MALKDIWKLQDYIPESAKAWTRKTLDVVSEALNVVPGVALPKILYKFYSDKTEMSGEDAVKAPEKIVGDIMEAMEKNKIPAWLHTPFILMVTASALAQTVGEIASTTNEKKILQPLRKQIRPSLLDADSVIRAQLRGLLKEDEVKDALGRMGLSDDKIKVLQKMAEYVPTAPDIVTFALREAYDESIAGKFGMDDNLGDVLSNTKEHRAMSGLTDELFTLYWRAHWDLPSITQGFEMLHRGAIKQDDLDLLLRAKDIMPYWREKLTQISYATLTRVDVRRMHKMKLMTDADLVKAYQDIGYKAADADRLAKFTIEYNKNPEAAEKTDEDANRIKERDLTKAEVVRAYHDRMIKPDKAKELMKLLGYSDDEVTLLLGREDFKLEQERLDRILKSYKNIYKKRIAGKDEITAQLQLIPLDKEQIDALFGDWDLEVLEGLDLPTRADVLRWYKKKLIDGDRTVEYLRAIGTQEAFIVLYMEENKP